ALDLPAALAGAIGLPPSASGGSASWPAEPFEPGLFGALSGQIQIRSARVALSPKLAARDLHGVLSFDNSQVALADIDGALAGGRIAGNVAFQRGLDGLTARSRFRLAAADITEFVPGDGRPPMSGRLTLEFKVEGTGRSPVALLGALTGTGTFMLQDGTLARLDPRA